MDPDRWERFTEPRRLQAGEMLTREGEPGREMFIIKSGQVVITKNTPQGEPLILSYRGTGEFIGEIALINDQARTASIVAVKPTELLAISHDQFWELLRTDEDFRMMVIETLINRLLTADESRVMAEMWERQLTEGVSSLATQQEQLEKIIQIRKQTLHFIVHDLRNPLNLAITALAMIEVDHGDERLREIKQFINMAQAGLNRVMLLVDSLLDVERLDHDGEHRLSLSEVDIAEMIREAIEMLKPMADATQVTLVADLPPEPLPTIVADRVRLDRVLVNLMDNSLRFTPSGGQITVRARQDGARLVVGVTDTGRGIPAEQRERVFDRFVQVEEGTGSRGYGLGLAYCRAAVQAHGGEIRADEGPGGVGTTMQFWLPLAPGDTPRTSQEH